MRFEASNDGSDYIDNKIENIYINHGVVIMLTPYDIRTSQVVVDHIREGHIVVCNLTNTDKNQRVVDYISGGVYGLGGRVEPTPAKTTFVCIPKTVSIVVENQDS